MIRVHVKSVVEIHMRLVNDDEIIRPKMTSHWLGGLECIDHTRSRYQIQFNVKNIIIID